MGLAVAYRAVVRSLVFTLVVSGAVPEVRPGRDVAARQIRQRARLRIEPVFAWKVQVPENGKTTCCYFLILDTLKTRGCCGGQVVGRVGLRPRGQGFNAFSYQTFSREPAPLKLGLFWHNQQKELIKKW